MVFKSQLTLLWGWPLWRPPQGGPHSPPPQTSSPALKHSSWLCGHNDSSFPSFYVWKWNPLIHVSWKIIRRLAHNKVQQKTVCCWPRWTLVRPKLLEENTILAKSFGTATQVNTIKLLWLDELTKKFNKWHCDIVVSFWWNIKICDTCWQEGEASARAATSEMFSVPTN